MHRRRRSLTTPHTRTRTARAQRAQLPQGGNTMTTVNTYDTNAVLVPDLRVIRVLVGLAEHWQREWCKPRQEKILELLERFTGRRMSRRNLNRHLLALERDGWIERIRRHRRAANGSLELHSTCYRIKRRSRDALRAITQSWSRFAAPRHRKSQNYAVPNTAHTVVHSLPMVVNKVDRTAARRALDEILTRLRRPRR